MTHDGLPPFRIARSAEAKDEHLPLLLSSPHSGRCYPAEFLARVRLGIEHLRRLEDAWIDVLLKPALAATGATMVAATYGRSLIDLNRAPDELDPDMFAAGLVPPPPAIARDRIAAGLGILPRVAGPGQNIYARRVDLDDANARIANIHRPYHQELTSRLAAMRQQFGFAVLIDCHSMPSLPPRDDGPGANIVLGDQHGRSAHPALSACIADSITAQGLSLVRNHPYAGGFTTTHHAAPLDGIHVLQVEIDRALYMDQQRLTPHNGFDETAQRLAVALQVMAARLGDLGLGAKTPLAAE